MLNPDEIWDPPPGPEFSAAPADPPTGRCGYPHAAVTAYALDERTGVNVAAAAWLVRRPFYAWDLGHAPGAAPVRVELAAMTRLHLDHLGGDRYRFVVLDGGLAGRCVVRTRDPDSGLPMNRVLVVVDPPYGGLPWGGSDREIGSPHAFADQIANAGAREADSSASVEALPVWCDTIFDEIEREERIHAFHEAQADLDRWMDAAYAAGLLSVGARVAFTPPRWDTSPAIAELRSACGCSTCARTRTGDDRAT